MASTYPLEVVEAARFAEQNRDLRANRSKTLCGTRPGIRACFRSSASQVLAMMNDKLEWTQQLGDAFLANEPRSCRPCRRCARRRRRRAICRPRRSRRSSSDRYIYIEPAQPQTVYVPVYNPTVIYGAWWWPTYRPWYWYPPPYYGYPASFVGVGIAFGAGYALGRYNWGWSNPNWRGGTINVNVNNNYYSDRYRNYNQNGNWQHNVDHRKGVAYRDTSVQNRYQRPASGAGAQTREAYRGYDQNRAGTASAQRPNTGQAGARPTTMDRPSPGASRPQTSPRFDRSSSPAYDSRDSRPQVQQQSQRGAQSRQTMSTSDRSMSTGGGGAARGGGGGGRGGGGGGGGGGRGGGGGGGRR